MNILSIVAFIIAGVVVVVGVHAAGDLKTFVDAHAMLIVFGGTLAASSISFQIDRVFLLFKVFLKRVIQGRKENYAKLIEDLMGLAEAYRTSSPNLEKMVNESKDFFLKEAMTMLMEEVLDEETLIKVLRARVKTIYDRQSDEVKKFATVGRFPPAFGLMGTTISMISLLQKLGQPGGQKLIGPSMALGLVATFQGLLLANVVFSPISENLADSAKEIKLKNTIIVEGVRLIIARTNPVVLAEELNSYLLPSERIDWKKVGAKKVA